ncbi:hypothetical protein BH09BAC1_BH09BAC1_02570 [soil metagenome]
MKQAIILLLISLALQNHLMAQGSSCNSTLAGVLKPKFPQEYYIDQGVKYFLTMQSDVPVRVQPAYAKRVIRWEWEPWLLLTGYKRSTLVMSDAMLKLTPTKYDVLDCRYFAEQPFCRCHVVFNYNGLTCPIYEEFTFNNQGEITFIEAWSDFPSLLPMGPGDDGIWDEKDYWAQNGAHRMATKVPGLGSDNGRIEPHSDCMREAMANDSEIADMISRMRNPVAKWMHQLLTHFNQVKGGCGAPVGDLYPYYVPK